jgi:hypothetical protein
LRNPVFPRDMRIMTREEKSAQTGAELHTELARKT